MNEHDQEINSVASEEAIPEESETKTEKTNEETVEVAESAPVTEKATPDMPEEKPESSKGLTVIIIVLAALLAVAVGVIGYILLKDKFGAQEPTSDTSDTSSAASEEAIDPETQKLYDTVVMTIDGEDITYENYRYYYLNCAATISGGSSEFWEKEENKDQLDEVKRQVLDELSYEIAVRHLAAEAGVTVTDEDRKNLQSNIDYLDYMYQYQYGITFSQAISSYFMTKNSYSWLFEYETLVDGLFEKYSQKEAGKLDFSEDKIAAEEANYCHVKHILYMADGTSSQTDEELLAKATKTANDLRSIENAEELEDRFDELIASDSADYDSEGENFYYFTTGEMDEAFEEASFALEEGAVSEPIKSAYGYHVILRLPIDREYFTQNIWAGKQFQALIREKADALTVTPTDFYNELTPLTAK